MNLRSSTSVPTINTQHLNSLQISLPSLPEQEKIWSLFEQLDSQITKNQQKLEKLKNMKQSFLQKLFPKDWSALPELRFKGFEGDWEERKLGEIAWIFDWTHQTPNYQTSWIMFLSVENIKTLKSNKFISIQDFEKNYKIYPQMWDILMTRIGDVWTTNIYKENKKVAFYVSLALIKPLNINNNYLNYEMNSFSFKKWLKERTLLTAIPQKINKAEIWKINVLFPSLPEQEKIWAFFEKLDAQITQQTQKLEKLKNLKQSLLEKMFI